MVSAGKLLFSVLHWSSNLGGTGMGGIAPAAQGFTRETVNR